ncbi:hypothetical protein JG688_00004220 [Phytophthora aleatoria]|uniref:Uncharacterized protein n=1 Tax=Phytophthora aleatoria TaxID=2496075 RepID=A0A8J5IRB3_9STRA|nr:hypothetical protein JG688_00004220 [Phytophthora aleatoria]
MPLLKKLLQPEELGDAPASATAEKLFASSIYAQEMRAQRQQAAALCSAPLFAIPTLESVLERLESCSIEQCVAAVLLVAREEKQVLFLVRDPNGVTKRLAAAVSSPDAAMTTELAAECLHRVRFRQCRDIYELLCALDHVQQCWEERKDAAWLPLVALGPLCDLFSGFQAASGITTTGAGLKRMVELAIKRLRATTSIHVSIMET